MSVLFHENPGTSLGEVKFVGNETDDTVETPDWITGLLPNNTIIDSEAHQAFRGFCRKALLYEVPGIGVRYWDLAILLPNLLFFIFLMFKLRPVINKLSTSNSPVYKAFFILVYLTTFLNIARSAVSIGFSITNPVGEILDRVLWLSLKFFSMMAELSVLTFALLFGHLDSSTSIRRALFITVLMSLGHTTVQTVLELRLVHKSLVEDFFFDLHSQGGLVFWFLTSVTFAVVYLLVSCLPLTCCRNYVSLPSKCSFYWYCAFLFLLNCFQALGVVFIFFKMNDGYCVTIFTTFTYFTFLPPVIYFTFLRSLLKRPASTSTGLFSYRKQKDERGTNDMPPYFPRFSGLTSPSYDDLFDLHRGNRFVDYDYTRDYLQCPYDTPLMASEPAESTVTTRTAGSDEGHHRDSQVFGSIELGQHARHPTSHLKGLGANGTLIFEDSRWK